MVLLSLFVHLFLKWKEIGSRNGIPFTCSVNKILWGHLINFCLQKSIQKLVSHKTQVHRKANFSSSDVYTAPGRWFMPRNGLRQAGWKQLEMLAVCPAHLPQVPTSAAGMAQCLINQHLGFCILQIGALRQANISFYSGQSIPAVGDVWQERSVYIVG